MVAEPPEATESKVQTVGFAALPGSPALHVPPLEETETMVTPAGSMSLTTVLIALEGPLLLTLRL